MASVVTATSILLAYGGGVSQRGQAGPVSDNLAVEIVGEEGRGTQFRVFDAPEGGSLGTCPATHLSEWKQPDGIPPITCLKLRAQKEDGSVRIKVFAVFDDSLPVDSPGPKYGQSEKLVANYLVREGEIVLVKELAEFGVEPVRLKVVMAAPQPVDPPLAAPGAAISKLDAIEVNAFGFDASDPKWYRLSLRNLTQKNIIALHIYQVDKGGVRVGYQTEMWSGPRRPLIVAGGMFETQVDHGAHRGVVASAGS